MSKIQRSKQGEHTPIDGTSAANVGGPIDGPPSICDNVLANGHEPCGAEIPYGATCCPTCAHPTPEAVALNRGEIHFDPANYQEDSSNILLAHDREAARLHLTRTVTRELAVKHGLDLDVLGSDTSVMAPDMKRKLAALQAEINEEIVRRFRASGLMPRRVAA